LEKSSHLNLLFLESGSIGLLTWSQLLDGEKAQLKPWRYMVYTAPFSLWPHPVVPAWSKANLEQSAPGGGTRAMARRGSAAILKSRLPKYQPLQASGPPGLLTLRSHGSGQVRQPAAGGEPSAPGGWIESGGQADGLLCA